MSPFVARHFPTPESFQADLDRLSQAYRAKRIQLVGGEPLLNPQIVELVKIARRSEIASQVNLTTNGVLLPRMKDDFWENVDLVTISLYPSVNIPEKDLEYVRARAAESNTMLNLRGRPDFRRTILTEANQSRIKTSLIFKTCKSAHKYQCHLLHEGRLFKCAAPAFLAEYLAAMNKNGYDSSRDALYIHESRDLFNDLKRFLFDTKPLSACSYCLGYVGKRLEHGQISREVVKDPASEPVTCASELNMPLLAKETVKYYGRRLVEKVTGRRKW
jgi:MoaA/NifB/PqqE/SkfB family radical SAM enzyme